MTHPAHSIDARRVGMLMFLLSEAAFFCTLITAYIVFLRQTARGTPSPADVFHLPLVLGSTASLLSSSVTVHIADLAFRAGKRFMFLFMWASTIALGILFLAGTAKEWHELITNFGLTISRNMFGTTYFTLVGFHAAHVTVGVLMLCVVLVFVARRRITEQNSVSVEMVSWYWHFVDGVWIVVFTVVYVVGR